MLHYRHIFFETIMDKEFLDTIGGPGAFWHFQTFDDKSKSGKSLTGAFSSEYTELVRGQLLIANEQGAGVFVAINEHNRGEARKKNTTTKIRAIFLDLDKKENGLTPQERLERVVAVLTPTMVVESSVGKYHVYYVLARSEDIPVAEFAGWQSMLINAFGGDKVVKDTTRVMRIPGFNHNKGDPQRVRIISRSGVRYGLDDLVAAFYGGRNNWLSSLGGGYRRNGVDQRGLEERLLAANARLLAPLDEDEVLMIARSASRYEAAAGKENEYKVAVLAQDLRLDTNKNGAVLPTLSNLRKLIESDEKNRRLIWTNVFSGRVEVAGDVPWGRHGGETSIWSDNDDVACRLWLIRKYGDIEWGRMDVRDVLVEQASVNHYDPLVDYFSRLVWDHAPRVDTVFHRHLEADDSPWTRAVARNFFIGAVKRALEPGCQHDEMVVFFGEEGTGKSSFSQAICPEISWFTDSLGDIRDKDSLQGLRGKWIVELGELKALMSGISEHIKAFLTSRVDNYRPSYGRYTLEFPRRCVFFGTTNNPKFLSDSGINRRFLPLEATGELDKSLLIAERDQLWAEALHMYRSGVTARISKELYDEAATRRLAVTEDGGYVGDILAYLRGDYTKQGGLGPPTVFIPREFYLTVVENASREKWKGESTAIGKQIANAAKIAFLLPEYKNLWEHAKFRHEGSIVRAWRRKR
jgi:hypothetical protein